MIDDKITTLQSCSYDNLAKNCKVFNLSTLNYHLWIYLNPEDVRDAYFDKGEEIGKGADNSKIFKDTFVRDGQCWIRANMDFLNLTTGKHTYRLSFIDRYTDTDFSLYISYIIQNDDPERPYVYMKEEEKKTTPAPHKPRILTMYKD